MNGSQNPDASAVNSLLFDAVFKASHHYPAGSPKGGQFMPSTGSDAPTVTFNATNMPPKALHGVAFKPWDDHPTTDADWAKVVGQNHAIGEGPAPQVPDGMHLGAGVIVKEPDGRVWIVHPSGEYGGYKATFPKGSIEEGHGLQATAIKEAFEESGLQVRITGVAGDVKRTTSVARYYHAERVGGTPAAAGWESSAVSLVRPDDLHNHLNHPIDQKLAHDHAGAPAPPAPKPKAAPAPGSVSLTGHTAAGSKQISDWVNNLVQTKGTPKPTTSNPYAGEHAAPAPKSKGWGQGGFSMFSQFKKGAPRPMSFDEIFVSTAVQKAGGQVITGNLCRDASGHFVACGIGGASIHGVDTSQYPIKTNGAAAEVHKQIAGYEALHAAGDLAGLEAVKPNLTPKKGAFYAAARAKAWQGLHDDLMKQHAAKGAAEAVTGPSTTLGWSKTGGQLGSNQGGQFVDPSGTVHYVKASKTADHQKNEILAARLYEMAGAPVTKMKAVTTEALTGTAGPGVASTWENKIGIDLGSATDKAAIKPNFAVHAWLANWDAVGEGHGDSLNQAVIDGKMTTLDVGGALLYRAQGQPKGAQFGSTVPEWDTMRSAKTPGLASKAFGGMTPEELFNAAKKVAAVDPKALTDLVLAHGPGDQAARILLAGTLLARRSDIIVKANMLGLGDVTLMGAENTAPDKPISAPVAVKVRPEPAPKLPIATPLPASSYTPGKGKVSIDDLKAVIGKVVIGGHNILSERNAGMVGAMAHSAMEGKASALKKLEPQNPAQAAFQAALLAHMGANPLVAPTPAPAAHKWPSKAHEIAFEHGNVIQGTHPDAPLDQSDSKYAYKVLIGGKIVTAIKPDSGMATVVIGAAANGLRPYMAPTPTPMQVALQQHYLATSAAAATAKPAPPKLPAGAGSDVKAVHSAATKGYFHNFSADTPYNLEATKQALTDVGNLHSWPQDAKTHAAAWLAHLDAHPEDYKPAGKAPFTPAPKTPEPPPAPEADHTVKQAPALPAKLTAADLSSPTNKPTKNHLAAISTLNMIHDNYLANANPEYAKHALAGIAAVHITGVGTYFNKVKKNQAGLASSIAGHAGIMAAAGGTAPVKPQMPDPIQQAPAAPPAPPKAQVITPKFDPSKLPAPPSFLNWGGSGKGGPSSIPLLNKANEDAVQAIHALGKKGDIAGIKALQVPIYNKETAEVKAWQAGQPMPAPSGMMAALQHPSQHIKGYAQVVLQDHTYQTTPHTVIDIGDHPDIKLVMDTMPVKPGETHLTHAGIGNFVDLGKITGAAGVGSDIKQFVTNDKQMAALFAKGSAAFHSLPVTQKSAIHNYTSGGYGPQNSSAWSGNPTGAMLATEEALKTKGHDIPAGMLLSRKVSFNSALLTKMKTSVGHVLQENAVISTAVKPQIWVGNVQFKITAAPGLKGIFMHTNSANPGEKELVLPPKTRFLIQAVVEPSHHTDEHGFGGGGMTVFHMLALPPS